MEDGGLSVAMHVETTRLDKGSNHLFRYFVLSLLYISSFNPQQFLCFSLTFQTLDYLFGLKKMGEERCA